MPKKVGRYILTEKRLGQGYFAVVYRGYSREDEQEEFAIKVINKSKMVHDEYLMGALFNEISILKSMKNKNIVLLQDVMETSNNYYIVQEYCEGGTLRQFLNAHRKLSEEQALDIFTQLLNGLIDLIRAGIIHRDIKPENILFKEGRIKLADFGLARYLGNFRKQALASYAGTPQYMAPQLILGTSYTSKSDVWSLGVILYEMVNGKQPILFKKQPTLEYVNSVKSFRCEFIEPVSPPFQDFVTRCLKYEEEERMSWNEVYQHPLIQPHFTDFVDGLKSFDEKLKLVANRLRNKIIEFNVDIKKLFLESDITEDNLINKVEFYRLMLSIDKNLSGKEIMQIFNEFDNNGDGNIDFVEFKAWIIENKITPDLPYK
jgi:serine/threonine protein kinase